MTIEEEQILPKKNNQISPEKQSKALLKIENLKTYFFVEEGVVKAVDGVSFTIFEDEVLGLVGETGCGKSVTALSIIRLVRAPGKIIEGKVLLRGVNLLDLTDEEMRLNRGSRITMIFQDPLNSLNPVLSVGKQVSEVFYLHQKEELQSVLDSRLMERERLIQEYKDLEQELKESEENNTLSEKEKKEFTRKIHELKKATSHKPNIESIALEKSAQIIKEIGIADAEGILK
ncbi:MAG: ATP-binding cassette domain-containing protein, partial [Promethearchaeota archaeon]